MEKTIGITVIVKIDDKEDCYCGECRFRNNSWCELFEETVNLDDKRTGYVPFLPSSRRYFRCDKCVESVRWNELFNQTMEEKKMEEKKMEWVKD